MNASPALESDDQLQNEFLLPDAEAAQGSVGALIEIMSSCAPGQQVTAIFMRSLLCDVKMHLDNVVDGLQHLPAQLKAV